MSVDAGHHAESSTGLSPRVGAMLAYGGWWVTGFIMWFVERRDPYIRFHAAQSMAVFGLLAVVMAALGAATFTSLLATPDQTPLFMWALGITWTGTLLVWMLAMWQTARGRSWRVPLVSVLVDRLVARGG